MPQAFFMRDMKFWAENLILLHNNMAMSRWIKRALTGNGCQVESFPSDGIGAKTLVSLAPLLDFNSNPLLFACREINKPFAVSGPLWNLWIYTSTCFNLDHLDDRATPGRTSRGLRSFHGRPRVQWLRSGGSCNTMGAWGADLVMGVSHGIPWTSNHNHHNQPKPGITSQNQPKLIKVDQNQLIQ